MELTVTQENLTRALTAVGRVASTKTQLPILSNILLRTDGTRLLIAATNLEIAATQLIGAKIAKPGSITIPAKLVAEFVASLPKGNVELLVKNDHLHIKAGTYSSVINGIASDDFPELPVIDEKKSIQYSISTDEFKQAVSQTILVASNDSTRPVLTGVYWHSFEGNLYLAATDGYRLTEKRLVETKVMCRQLFPLPHYKKYSVRLLTTLQRLNYFLMRHKFVFDLVRLRSQVASSTATSLIIASSFLHHLNLS